MAPWQSQQCDQAPHLPRGLESRRRLGEPGTVHIRCQKRGFGVQAKDEASSKVRGQIVNTFTNTC